MSTEYVCGTDENEGEENGVYPTWEAAIAAALVAAGPGGSIVVHSPGCPYEASTGIGCNCTPQVYARHLLSAIHEPGDLCKCGHRADEHAEDLPSSCNHAGADVYCCIGFDPVEPRLDRAQRAMSAALRASTVNRT